MQGIDERGAAKLGTKLVYELLRWMISESEKETKLLRVPMWRCTSDTPGPDDWITIRKQAQPQPGCLNHPRALTRYALVISPYSDERERVGKDSTPGTTKETKI
jgi:hypothetical protein